MSLTRDQIKESSDHTSEKVNVPEWGGEVYVKTMTGNERDRLEMDFFATGRNGKRNVEGLRARMALYCCCDEAGKRLFKEEDFLWLIKKSAPALQRVFNVAMRLNAFSDDDVDELAKN